LVQIHIDIESVCTTYQLSHWWYFVWCSPTWSMFMSEWYPKWNNFATVT